ncbi:Fur family transcriptional regulator [Anaerovorax odorimutans]|uniref:Fur family transcriptional regulator n=1 Tax=Anaerovorax odorimutans TaxID=109327 RepID=UPI00042078B3|nr:Fur family transcriptional regulator [Anaerovorax odorimutans]
MSETMSPYLLKLKSHDIKITEERKNLIRIFLQYPDYHFTPNELYDKLKASGYGIGFATIYRNLKLFHKLNFIRPVTLDDGSKKYELNHIEIASPVYNTHLICSKCGKVMDFQPENNNLVISNLPDSSFFNIENIEVQIRGICPECMKQFK